MNENQSWEIIPNQSVGPIALGVPLEAQRELLEGKAEMTICRDTGEPFCSKPADGAYLLINGTSRYIRVHLDAERCVVGLTLFQNVSNYICLECRPPLAFDLLSSSQGKIIKWFGDAGHLVIRTQPEQVVISAFGITLGLDVRLPSLYDNYDPVYKGLLREALLDPLHLRETAERPLESITIRNTAVIRELKPMSDVVSAELFDALFK